MRNIFSVPALIFCFLMLSLSSCRRETHSHETSSAAGPASHQAHSAETQAMIDSVRKAQDAIDPMKVTVLMTKQRAALFKQKSETATGLEKPNLMLMFGFEELKAGHSKEAMRIFQEVLQYVQPLQIEGKDKTVMEIKKLIALSALRLGEQENCILNHTSASCVVPIASPGQHSKIEGSTLAMKMYEDILKENPGDLTSRYLLNIAAMTLGQFPDGVPVTMRLPPDFFDTSVDFPPFTDIATELGLARRGLAGGIAVEDFDRDGDLDIMHSSWGFNDQILLHRNNGDGTFEEVAQVSGLKGVTGGLNLRHADYNNDGYADVLILRGAWLRDQGRIPNSLLKNNGDGTFTDVTVSAGIYSKMPTQNAVWADFDLDGWLDLFIGNESIPNQGPAFNFPSQLYHNQKDGTFREVSREAGLNVNSFVKGSTGGDVNNDGKEDLYISSLNTYNSLWLNRSDEKGLKFENVSGRSGTAEPLVSFPTWMFDFNNDGWLDIFVSAYSDGSDDLPGKVLAAYGKKDDPFRPRLYKNNSDGSFSEMSSSIGLTEPAYTMGCNYGDLDNDGYPDFYLGTGEPNLKSIVPNKMYWNREGKHFSDITYTGGFGNIQKGHAVGFGDMDKDGDQDIYVVMGGSFEGDVYQNLFFENPIGQDNRWIILQLEGVKANRLALGARVEIVISEDGKTRSIHEVVSTGASFGGNSLQLEIGLGKAEKIEKIKVYWPSRQSLIQEFKDVGPDKAYFLKEGETLKQIDYHKVPLKKADTQHQSHH
jgi:hypothetical protein